jgi:hypothetical protein
MNTRLIPLISEHEQDMADCLAWMESNDDAAKNAVWDYIQAKTDDPLAELVLRFAQLGFTEAFLRWKNHS